MLTVLRVPAFNDNYFWIATEDNKHALVVDPGDAAPVIEALDKNGLILTDILLTHHHADHIGGVAELQKLFSDVNVFGPATERFTMVSHPCKSKDDIKTTALSQALQVIEVPGHTLDHIAYYSAPYLFVGDTLFSAGCGRLFEGTPKQMLDSLAKLSSLPNDTQVFCAHEYTLSNLTFAKAALPSCDVIKKAYFETVKLRDDNLPTVPTSIEKETEINPFLRCHTEELQLAMQKNFSLPTRPTELETFTLLRKWKDEF